MNVVFIGPFGLQPKGTMSARALPLATALAARGHAVTVLIPPWDDPARAGQVWEADGVRVINVSLPTGNLARLPLLFHILLTRTLVMHTLVLSPDVVHCFKPKAYAGLSHLVLWWLRRWRGLSLRLVVDADDWEQAWNVVLPYSVIQKRFFAWQERWGLKHADAITVASRALSDLVTQQLGIDPARVFYVPNGYPPASQVHRRNGHSRTETDLAATGWNETPTILLYSRFAEFRLDRIVTLVRNVAAQVPAARWLIVGRGFQAEERTLAAQLAQAGLDRYVTFAGFSFDELPAYFEAADVAVYPYDDTMLNRTKCSVKLIDLLAAGIPVVADAVGQNCEYIQHNQSGCLVPAEDDAAFSRMIITLLQEPETRQRLGHVARQSLQQKFAWSDLAETLEKSYH
jgi:glycosyltransferase involved in cell wall biosynthesis